VKILLLAVFAFLVVSVKVLAPIFWTIRRLPGSQRTEQERIETSTEEDWLVEQR